VHAPFVRPAEIGGSSRRGIGAGERHVIVGLSVLIRKVRGMSERGFGRTRGEVCSPGLHLACCPKYRRRILGGWEIVAKQLMPDQVRLFVRMGPGDALAAVVRALKGRTTRVARGEYRYLGRLLELWWSPAIVLRGHGRRRLGVECARPDRTSV
jgi:putative transposase